MIIVEKQIWRHETLLRNKESEEIQRDRGERDTSRGDSCND